MTIREMFQKIEKAGFADVQVTRDVDGIQILDNFGDLGLVCRVYKNIDPAAHALVYTLILETGEQCVEEMKVEESKGEFKLVCRTYLDDEGKPTITVYN